MAHPARQWVSSVSRDPRQAVAPAPQSSGCPRRRTPRPWNVPVDLDSVSSSRSRSRWHSYVPRSIDCLSMNASSRRSSFCWIACQDRWALGETCTYYWLLLAEGHLTRRRFEAMLKPIWTLPVQAADPAAGYQAVRRKRDRNTGAVPGKWRGLRAVCRTSTRDCGFHDGRSRRRRMFVLSAAQQV